MQMLKPPRTKLFVDQDDKKLYTIKKANVPFTWRINDRTTMISFKELEQTITIASSLESHFYHTKSWPDMTAEKFELKYGPLTVPNILDIYEEEWNDVKEYCAMWNMGLLVVNNLKIHDTTILFSGDLVSFQAPTSLYLDHLEHVFGIQA